MPQLNHMFTYLTSIWIHESIGFCIHIGPLSGVSLITQTVGLFRWKRPFKNALVWSLVKKDTEEFEKKNYIYIIYTYVTYVSKHQQLKQLPDFCLFEKLHPKPWTLPSIPITRPREPWSRLGDLSSKPWGICCSKFPSDVVLVVSIFSYCYFTANLMRMKVNHLFQSKEIEVFDNVVVPQAKQCSKNLFCRSWAVVYLKLVFLNYSH